MSEKNDDQKDSHSDSSSEFSFSFFFFFFLNFFSLPSASAFSFFLSLFLCFFLWVSIGRGHVLLLHWITISWLLHVLLRRHARLLHIHHLLLRHTRLLHHHWLTWLLIHLWLAHHTGLPHRHLLLHHAWWIWLLHRHSSHGLSLVDHILKSFPNLICHLISVCQRCARMWNSFGLIVILLDLFWSLWSRRFFF